MNDDFPPRPEDYEPLPEQRARRPRPDRPPPPQPRREPSDTRRLPPPGNREERPRRQLPPGYDEEERPRPHRQLPPPASRPPQRSIQPYDPRYDDEPPPYGYDPYGYPQQQYDYDPYAYPPPGYYPPPPEQGISGRALWSVVPPVIAIAITSFALPQVGPLGLLAVVALLFTPLSFLVALYALFILGTLLALIVTGMVNTGNGLSQPKRSPINNYLFLAGLVLNIAAIGFFLIRACGVFA